MAHPKVKTESRSGPKHKMVRASAYIEYKNVDPAVETALYYGFTPLSSPLVITKEDRDRAQTLGDEEKSEPFSLAPALEERVAMMRRYEEKNLAEAPQPVMFTAEFLSGSVSRKKPGERRLAVEIMGGGKSIAEATLIQTAFATLRGEGYAELSLFVNSVGDRESMNRFLRELASFYRKHVAALPQSCRTLLRKNPLELLRCEHEKCRALTEEAPKSIGCLGDESRRHFKEVLEFLEELEIPYQIEHTLLGNRAFATETVFEVREALALARPNDKVGQGKSRCLCSGLRYNNLGRRLGLRKEVPSVGMNLLLTRTGKESAAVRRVRFRKPSVFFLQLGFCAKLKSLRVIELLRQARVPLHQALNRDKLASQMSSAENLKIPYSIILGQREALENSVIVRNTETRAQETVPIARLAEYVKKLKLA